MTEEGQVVNVDGVDVVVSATRDNGDGSWAWSCRWCAVTGAAGSRDMADQELCDHVDELHDADVVIAWREGHPAPVMLDACPQPLRAWTAALLERFPDSILFVTLFGPLLTGVGEASSWRIRVDLRPLRAGWPRRPGPRRLRPGGGSATGRRQLVVRPQLEQGSAAADPRIGDLFADFR